MRRAFAIVAAIGLAVASASAQRVDEARQALAATRRAGDSAQAETRRLDAAAAAADARVIQTGRTVAELGRALAQSDVQLAAARRRLADAEAARASGDRAFATARAPLAALVAALVRRQRQPSSALLAASPNLHETMRLRAALAAVAPTIDAHAAGLRGAIADATNRQREAAAAVETVAAQQRVRDARRAALQRAMVEATRQRDRALADAVVVRQQADGLAEHAARLEALVHTLDRQDEAGARLAALPGPTLRPGTGTGTGTVPMPAPAPAPASRAYRMPARGRLLAGTGETSTNGIRTRGLLLATNPDAIVRAPARGMIAYAGAFRAWRAIVILDHGHGWTTLIAGLSTVAHPSGVTVQQGAPLGRAGTRLLVELRHHGRPVDIAAMAAAST